MILIPPRQLGLAQGNQAAVKAAGIGTPGSQQCRRGASTMGLILGLASTFVDALFGTFANVRALSGY
jgi:hypothetical protein